MNICTRQGGNRYQITHEIFNDRASSMNLGELFIE